MLARSARIACLMTAGSILPEPFFEHKFNFRRYHCFFSSLFSWNSIQCWHYIRGRQWNLSLCIGSVWKQCNVDHPVAVGDTNEGWKCNKRFSRYVLDRRKTETEIWGLACIWQLFSTERPCYYSRRNVEKTLLQFYTFTPPLLLCVSGLTERFCMFTERRRARTQLGNLLPYEHFMTRGKNPHSGCAHIVVH